MASEQIGYMRKYAAATADLQRWLEDKLQPHREKHLASLLAAEARYKEIVESEPDPDWYRADSAGFQTKYWKTNEQMFIGYFLAWREMDARKEMEDAILEADRQYERDTHEIYAIYESRLKGTIERLGKTG